MNLTKRRLKLIKTIYVEPNHPILLCLTCGKISQKVMYKNNDSLRKIPARRYKTWKRHIKYSDLRRTFYKSRVCKQKEIYYSYELMDCIQNKHKISIRKKPFSIKLVKEGV